MQQNVILLSKLAIKEALAGNWEKVIEINTQLLEKYPENIDAKLRLGHALIQTKHLIKAKKVFNEVVEVDPLNPIALKNLQLIASRAEVVSPAKADAGALIKEPGTTAEIELQLIGRGTSVESFAPGESLGIEIKKRVAEVFRTKKDKPIKIGELTQTELLKCLNRALNEGARVTASYIKGKDKVAEILVKCSIPVFKSERQDIRPYIKKGTLDDPELDEEEELEVELS